MRVWIKLALDGVYWQVLEDTEMILHCYIYDIEFHG
jgi:hypothetical protein